MVNLNHTNFSVKNLQFPLFVFQHFHHFRKCFYQILIKSHYKESWFFKRFNLIKMSMYNTNGFRTETMYDYYIAMKFMSLVVKISSHSSIGYASLIILLPRTTHKQHQNYSKPKAFQNQNFNSHKLCIHIITLYKWRCPSRSQNTSLNGN